MRTFFTAAMAGLAMANQAPELIESTPNGYVGFNILEDGAPKTVYIGSPFWFTGGGGDTMDIPPGGRIQLLTSPTLSPEAFYKPNLLGGYIEYDVDMSTQVCGCLATLYLVRSPAHDSSGNYDNTDGFYYCDGHAITGEYCPEFDIMEANQYAFQTTAHECYSAGNGHYSDCNHGGSCIQNTVDNWNHSGQNNYGPGGQYTIDTTQKYTVRIDFCEDNSQFSTFTLSLTQNGKTVSETCAGGNNSMMTDDLKGNMAIIVSQWSGDATWLWKDSCGGSCSSDPKLYFTNMKVGTTGATCGSGPSPSGDYDYGDACATKGDDFCDGSCDCRWSWPKSDPAKWSSKDAACRCKA